MASCSTEQWSTQYTPQAKLTVTESSSTDTTVTLAWTLQYVTHGYTADTNGYGRAWSVTIDGSEVDSGTTNIDGKSTYTVASGTKTVNKTTSSRNVSFSVSFEFDITWTDVYGGTKTASGSIAIDAKTSYTVSFNANGGSGAPSSQTKWHGTNLTLSSTKPTRSGYTFQGWGTSSSDTSVDYNAGGTYTANASDTLYAIWKKTITLTYNANGGTGAPSSQSATIYNATTNYKFTLSSTKPTKTGYTFLGWSTSNTATSSSYASGGSITLSTSDTLYAVWSENKLTVNYYSNYATYGTYQGEELTVSSSTNIKVHSQEFLYDNSYSSALSNVQNSDYLYLARMGYVPNGYWGAATTDSDLVDEDDTYTGQALAVALGKDLSSGSASVNVYPQWTINTYTFSYDSNGGKGTMDSITVEWGGTFILPNNTFKREGYKFVGWNAYRNTDGTWYVAGQGWVTEDEIIENGYDKKLYQSQEEHVFGHSWVKGDEYTISDYTMYAVWEISGVVYIDNGAAFEPYLAYIDDGTNWNLYLMYVDNGNSWDIIS